MKNKSILVLSFFALVVSLQAKVLYPSNLYQLAMENAKEIKSLEFHKKAKEESLEQVYAKLYPQIYATANYTEFDYEINNNQFRTEYDIKENYSDYGINLNQVIYDGTLFSQLASEKLKVALFNIDIELEKQNLKNSLFQAYFEAMDSSLRVELTQTIEKYYQYQYETLNEKYKISLANEMDMLKAKVDYQNARLEAKKEKKLFGVYVTKLENYTGSLEGYVFPRIDIDALEDSSIEQLLLQFEDKTTLENNLQILQAKLHLKLAKENKDGALAGHLPTLSLSANYTQYDSDEDTTDYENTQRVMVQLKLPLYSGGGVNSKMAAAKYTTKASIVELENVKNEVSSQFNQELVIYRNYIEATQMYKELYESTKMLLRSIRMGFEKGLKSKVDLYEAKSKLGQIKSDYLQSIYKSVESYNKLSMIINKPQNLKNLDLLFQ